MISIHEMETYTGKYFDLSKPDSSKIDIEDIAWHLSRFPRFNGATRSEHIYNIAQHSVLVLNRVKAVVSPERQTFSLLMTALLHDAHEAYTGDMIRPIGQLLDLKLPVKRLKERVQRAVYVGLLSGTDFVPYVGPYIQDADKWAASFEAYHLMHSKGLRHPGKVTLEEYEMYQNFIVWDSMQSYEKFKREFFSILNNKNMVG